MPSFIKIKDPKKSVLERFGTYYLNFFLKVRGSLDSFDFTDEQIKKETRKITLKGLVLSSLVSIVFVLPAIWVDIHFEDRPFLVHYGWVAAVTVVCIAMELYLLFLISLKLVTDISKLVRVEAVESDYMQDGLFSVKSVLARTALELPDPELEILGIDPFKRISRKNLLVIGLIYKAKILLTNLVIKNILLLLAVKSIMGFSILYEAVFVECFWNGVVVLRVINEARLRLFGFALATRIIEKLKRSGRLKMLSPEAKTGCLRAIGNAVVMTQNYHPNMIILLLSFQRELGITGHDRYDDWDMFLKALREVNERERYFLLDLFTVAAAFDGKISSLEEDNLQQAYDSSHALYYPRLVRLTGHLKKGRLNQALTECELDFEEG